MAHASEEAIRHERLAGQPRSRLTVLSLALLAGPRPADEALRDLDAALPEHPRPDDMLLRAVLVAMLGRFDEAWPLAREANDRLRAFRGSFEEAWLAEIATLEGHHEVAAGYLRRSCDAMEARGMTNVLSGAALQLARALCALRRRSAAASSQTRTTSGLRRFGGRPRRSSWPAAAETQRPRRSAAKPLR
jgi:hypothetical protein